MSSGHPPVRLSELAAPHRVDIVSGSFGTGHDVAAEAIAHQLRERGHATRTWDVVDLMPGHLGRMLRSGYLTQIQSMPATWRWTLAAIDRHDSVMQGIVRALRQRSQPCSTSPQTCLTTSSRRIRFRARRWDTCARRGVRRCRSPPT